VNNLDGLTAFELGFENNEQRSRECEYQSKLDYETKKLYKEKLSLEGERIPIHPTR